MLFRSQTFVEIGGVRVSEYRLKMARGTNHPYKMGRKLLTEFFMPGELQQCGCVPTTNRPKANPEKLAALLGSACGPSKI